MLKAGCSLLLARSQLPLPSPKKKFGEVSWYDFHAGAALFLKLL
ncbi:unnamed protein product [Arabidopsis thaliana]|uniref:Uncharacterized protein n=3 Tax=Arabidopsis TaxID=3701 RepID=A0A654EUG3_ARATH|nr:uncharacterized protein AT2G14692 [Arabidopsis thaliana]AEC06323.1 hypothetical protein AT2G14692 [Arabidopsis thaliana]KAG7636213.1 hypothetical protein ISN45_At02g008450 [Arabidopsis thaliana x Arabidopsis arenosa]VYS52390.1 unnamed protein product [Arabidopsis thaliana]|eukprot:NP_001318224.1 hypothetical protein AT2G14692 [Arabidopsis thaliana]